MDHKDDSGSQWKSGKFDPRSSQNPEPIVTKFCTGDYVGDPYRYAKFHNDPITAEPIFTISTSNDVVSRKDVPFGGLENKILQFDPIFPQTEIFGQVLTGLRNSRLKKAAQSLSGVISSPVPSLNSLSLSVTILERFYC